MSSRSRIINLWIDNISFKESLEKVIEWGISRESRFVCFANVHMAIEAYRDGIFHQNLQKASLVLPDGKPIALACQWLYNKKQERVAGMDFMPALLKEADKLKAKIFLYGSTTEVLKKLIAKINIEYPAVSLVGSISPRFGKMTKDETEDHIKQINKFEAHFILVALGCPKQEKWMAENYGNISGILLGVGGAFSVMAGLQKRAPKWMQRYGLEWFYRLRQEPRRLLKRYLVTNSQFILLFFRQLVKQKFFDRQNDN